MQKEINKENIIRDLSSVLFNREEILFVIIHGSFINKDNFNDIDVAVYLKEYPESILQYELGLEAKLIMSDLFPREVDIRVINKAPLYFQYNVIRNGTLLFTKKNEVYADFKELVIRDYLDFLPHYREYLKDASEFEL